MPYEAVAVGLAQLISLVSQLFNALVTVRSGEEWLMTVDCGHSVVGKDQSNCGWRFWFAVSQPSFEQ